jgi:hypothetical protein
VGLDCKNRKAPLEQALVDRHGTIGVVSARLSPYLVALVAICFIGSGASFVLALTGRVVILSNSSSTISTETYTETIDGSGRTDTGPVIGTQTSFLYAPNFIILAVILMLVGLGILFLRKAVTRSETGEEITRHETESAGGRRTVIS